MSKLQIRETANASAIVVLNPKREHVARVQWQFPKDGAGVVRCDVWARAPGERYLSLVHQKRAGGYGYDKRTAALSGAVIEGYRMANHCGHGEEKHETAKARLMRAYIRAASRGLTDEETRAWQKKAEKIGARFANYCRTDDTPTSPDGKGYRYASLHTVSGLERLSMLGFTLIDAL